MSEIRPVVGSEGYSLHHPDHAEPDITPPAGGRPNESEVAGGGSGAGAEPVRPTESSSVASVAGDPGARAPEEPDEPLLPLRQRLEALLVIVDEPVAPEELGRVLGVNTAAVTETLAALRADYLADHRGFELRDIAGGWRLYSAAECGADVERFVLGGTQARLTHAALETLAVIAYRQPVSRQSIAAIRGVGVEGVVRTLLARGLIAESGAGAAGATLYVTTPHFLSRLGLRALDDLPSLAPYLPEDLDEFDEAF